MKNRIILLLVLVSILATLIPIARVDMAEGQSCYSAYYIIAYTEVMKGDTWNKIANHWGMSVSTLRAMNRGVKLVRGAQVKIAVLAGCY